MDPDRKEQFEAETTVRYFNNDKAGFIAPIRIRGFTVSKIETSLARNCDQFAVSNNGQVIGLSDGASRSFNSHEWARKLVRFALTQTEIPLSKINWAKFAQSTLRRVKRADDAHVRIARSRGSQATLMRLQVSQFDSETIQIRIEAIGDCLFCIIPNEHNSSSDIMAWPFEGVENFPELPSVVSSVQPSIRGNFEDPQVFFCGTSTTVLLMTDALGRYVCSKLAAGYEILEILPFLNSGVEFEEWARVCRKNGEVENDDLTLVEVSFK